MRFWFVFVVKLLLVLFVAGVCLQAIGAITGATS